MTSEGSSTTTSTAGTEGKAGAEPPSRRPPSLRTAHVAAPLAAAKAPDLESYVGTTRRVRLRAGLRPFLVVRVAPGPPPEIWGWLFPDSLADSDDPFLKSYGLQADARRHPCYLLVRPHDLV